MKVVNAHLPHVNNPLGSDLDLTVGRIVLLLGDSGCGKTSLLKAIAGFADLADGEISGDERVAMLLQNPFHQIIMQKVHDELLFPLLNAGIEKSQAEIDLQKISADLQITDLLDRDLSTLSFGETQLVMIAATCLTPANMLLMDEPTSHLDPPYIKRFYSCMRNLADEGKSICISSQSPDEYMFADEIWIMERGRMKTMFSAKDCPKALKDAGIELDSDKIKQRMKGLSL